MAGMGWHGHGHGHGHVTAWNDEMLDVEREGMEMYDERLCLILFSAAHEASHLC